MENKFSKNLAKYRKKSGLTQAQLAEKISVTPQAVSKWENGSLPDSEFLPSIAQILGISIDVLFGIAEESSEPDIEQLIINKIRQTPPRERSDYIMQLFYAILSAYNEYKLSKIKYPKELELETYAELKTENELAAARLNDDLKYFCFMQIPEDGIDSYVTISDKVSDFFEMLSDKDAIRIVRYLGSGFKNRMQSLEVIAERTNISLDKVTCIMDKLDRFGLAWRVSAEISNAEPTVYGYVNSVPLTFSLALTNSLTRYLRFHDLYIDTWERGPFRGNGEK